MAGAPSLPLARAALLSLALGCTQPSVTAVTTIRDGGPVTRRAPDAATATTSLDAGFQFQPSDAMFGAPEAGCVSAPDEDRDQDGYSVAQGDCNDCDKLVNPGALDVPGNLVDEDCNATADDEPTGCDSGLAADGNAAEAARALGLCRTADPAATGKARTWGLVRAAYVFPDGTTAAIARGDNSCGKTGDPPNPLQHGILATFGQQLKPRAGAAMVALSSGIARSGTQTIGKIGPSPDDAEMCTRSRTPAGFPVSSYSTCGDIDVPAGARDANDAIALELVIRAPTNASALSFDFDFYTFEYKEFVCTDYNDAFVALLYSKVAGLPTNNNIAFDAQQNPVSVNNGFVEVCKPWTYEGTKGTMPFTRRFPCQLGTEELRGTGFEDHAATGWLQTTTSVVPGEELTLRFAIWDAGDEALDSTVLIDNLRWDAKAGTTATTRPPDVR
jgi:hypothetical protein